MKVKHKRKLFKIFAECIGFTACVGMSMAFYGILTTGQFIAIEPITPIAILEFVIMTLGVICIGISIINDIGVKRIRWCK